MAEPPQLMVDKLKLYQPTCIYYNHVSLQENEIISYKYYSRSWEVPVLPNHTPIYFQQI